MFTSSQDTQVRLMHRVRIHLPAFRFMLGSFSTTVVCARMHVGKSTRNLINSYFMLCMGKSYFCYGFHKALCLEASVEIDSMRTNLSLSFPIRWIRF